MAENDPAVVNQPQDEVIERTVAGSVYKGTKDEIIEQLVKSQEHANITLKERKEQIEAMQSIMADRPAETPAPASGAGYSPKQYYEDWQAGKPEDATVNVLAHSLGFKNAEEFKTWNQSQREIIEEIRDSREVARFRQHVGDEYPESPETARLMMDQIERNLGKSTAPRREDMLMAYDQLVREGKLTPNKKEPETERRPRRVPPGASAMGGGGGEQSSVPSAADLMAMPEAEFEKQLTKAGIKRT